MAPSGFLEVRGLALPSLRGSEYRRVFRPLRVRPLSSTENDSVGSWVLIQWGQPNVFRDPAVITRVVQHVSGNTAPVQYIHPRDELRPGAP